MASRKLRVEAVEVTTWSRDGKDASQVTIMFSRKLTSLEVSGVKAVLEGEIQ